MNENLEFIPMPPEVQRADNLMGKDVVIWDADSEGYCLIRLDFKKLQQNLELSASSGIRDAQRQLINTNRGLKLIMEFDSLLESHREQAKFQLFLSQLLLTLLTFLLGKYE